MERTRLLAEYLRAQARWRLDRVERQDGCATARSVVALLDAAAYVIHLGDGDPMIQAMAAAGCFHEGRFDPGENGRRLVRLWHYDTPGGDPSELLRAIAAAVHVPSQAR